MSLTVRLPERLQPAMKVAPVRPAIMAGLRAATATVTPLVVGHWLHMPALFWASMAGFSVSLADLGGAYRTRALSMGSLVIFGALGVTVAGIAGRTAWAAVPLMFVVTVLTSLVRVYGNTPAVVGTSVATAFLVSLALPAATPTAALERGALYIVGGAWAMALSLVLWPLRPYRPARLDVARCYRAVATYASHLAWRVEHDEGGAARDAVALADRGAVRESLERARATLVGVRRGRQESGRGERLLVLLEIADQAFGTLLVLGEVLDSVPPLAAAAPAREAAERALEAFTSTALQIGRLVGAELRSPPPTLDWGGDAVRAALDASAGDASEGAVLARAACARAATLLDQLRSYAETAGETAATLEDDGPVAKVAGSTAPEPAPPAARSSLLTPLRDALVPDSEILRHALRVGIVTAAAVALTSWLGLPRGYWVTLTALVVLQPQEGATFIKVVQRVAGTVLGGMLTVGIAWAVHGTPAIFVVIFLLAATSVALLPINYGVFSIFVTATFVLLAEVNAGDWHLARVRILNTLIGGVLALVGARLLWPRAGRAKVEERIGASLDALRSYLARIAEYERDGGGAARLGELAAARRGVGLAALNAETALQWRLGEARAATSRLEPVMAALTYTRRLASAATALTRTAPGTMPDGAPGEGASNAVAAFASAADRVLADMAVAVVAERVPAPMPPGLERGETHDGGPPDALDPLLRAQLERAGRQLATLHSAVSRLAGGEPATPVVEGA